MTEPSATIPPNPTDTASVAEDFVDIFVSPAKVFARRVKASPMVPFLVVSVVLIVLFFASKNLLSSIFDAEMQKGFDAAMKANPQLTPEILEKSKPMMNISISIKNFRCSY